jgi:tetratricopeptide (TPR) repeat protein
VQQRRLSAREWPGSKHDPIVLPKTRQCLGLGPAPKKATLIGLLEGTQAGVRRARFRLRSAAPFNSSTTRHCSSLAGNAAEVRPEYRSLLAHIFVQVLPAPRTPLYDSRSMSVCRPASGSEKEQLVAGKKRITIGAVTVPSNPQRSWSTARIWVGVPPRNKNFTGRSDILEQLRLRAGDRGPTVLLSKEPLPQALQGLGGVGKTAVSIEYAYRYGADYDLVCWIRADQTPLVRSALAGLADILGLGAPSASGIDMTTQAVLNALRRGEPYSRWLLIFDNADQPEELLPFIPGGPGDVLITSRNHRWGPIVETIALDVFERAESVQFLLKRIPKRLSETDADRLAESLGDLPLALEQAGAVLYESLMSVDDYLQLLDERVAEILAQGVALEYPTSMTAAWQISVAQLRRQMPQALELLRCCAFLGPEPIPRELFKLGSQESQTGVGALIADPIVLSTAFSVLGRFALVKMDGPYITVHRLNQALLRAELDPSEQNRYRYDAHSILATGAPGSPADVRTWHRYRDLVAHAGSATTDLAHCLVPEHRAFALDVVRYLYVSGDFASCRTFAERFIEQWTKDSGPADPDVLDANRHLGNTLRELGQAAAADRIIENTLRSAQTTLGPRDPLTLHLRNAFGADLRARGDFTAALALDEETCMLHDEIFGPADPQTLRARSNLAIDYVLNSRYVDARELYKDVYIRQRDTKPDVRATDVLQAWTGLARALRLCGNFSQARDLGQEAMAYGLHELGPEHYLTLRAEIDLPVAMRRIPAEYDEAIELASDTREQCRRHRGERNPDTMAAAISLSNTQRVVGHTAQALELATAIAESYPSVYGPEHPYNYGCIGNLAVLRRLSGDLQSARQLNEKALAGLDMRLTRDHFFSLSVAVNLASDLAELGETRVARALSEDSLARLTRLLGEDHFLTLSCAANLALDLSADGADEAARTLSVATTDRCALVLGTHDPLTEAAAGGSRIDVDFDPPPI